MQLKKKKTVVQSKIEDRNCLDMSYKNEQYNVNGLALIGISSAGLGWFIDQLLKFNDNSFLISYLLPIIMIGLYWDYLIIDLNTSGNLKPKSSDKWKHKIFTFIVFLFISRFFFGITALFLGMPLFNIKIDGSLFLSITLTTIVVSIFGDKILYYWFKVGRFESALEYKEDFFNQSDVRLFIYFSYFVFLLILNYGFKEMPILFWVGVFATYIAFERFWKHLEERKKKAIENKKIDNQ